MHRIALRFLKFGLPTAYLLYQTNKIWNIQQMDEQDKANQKGRYKVNHEMMDSLNKITQSQSQEDTQQQKQRQKAQQRKQDNQKQQNQRKTNESELIFHQEQQIKQDDIQNQNESQQQQNPFPQKKQQSQVELGNVKQSLSQVFEQAGNDTQAISRVESQRESQYAIVSADIPQVIINYLKMYHISAKVDSSFSSSQIQIVNRAGDRKKFKFGQSDCYQLQDIASFLNPPKVVKSYQQVKNIFKNLQPDQYITAAYIPNQSQYKDSKLPKNYYDTFTPLQSVDIQQIQLDFRLQKYNKASRKYCYFIIRDQEVAKHMKMNLNRIGDRYTFYKSSPNHGMEVSTLIQGIKYTIRTTPLQQTKSRAFYNKRQHSYLNEINYDMDMKAFLNSMLRKQDQRKILVLYSRQKRPQFVNSVKEVAIKVGKLLREEVIIIYTNNQALLSKYFQIIPDNFVTIRLIDVNKQQPPLFYLAGFNHFHSKIYSRKIMSGPFTVDNLCNFIRKNDRLNQYYEQKKELNKIPQITSENQKIPNKTVILHWKYGCRGCELALDYLQKIKQIFQNLNEEQRIKFQIVNAQETKQISFRKYNILNEDGLQSKKQSGGTPKIFLYINGEMRDLRIGDIIGRINSINPHNEEEVHMKIMKDIIQSIEKEVQVQ